MTAPRWQFIFLFGLTAAMPLRARAQEVPAPEDWSPRRGSSRLFGAGYQSPDGPVLSAGLIVGTVPGKANKCIFGATSSGMLLQGQIGLNGPKISAGVAQYNPGFGIGAKVSALHLWRPSGESAAGTTLVGPEAQVSIFVVRLSAGILWPVAGPEEESQRITWGVGLGF